MQVSRDKLIRICFERCSFRVERSHGEYESQDVPKKTCAEDIGVLEKENLAPHEFGPVELLQIPRTSMSILKHALKDGQIWELLFHLFHG